MIIIKMLKRWKYIYMIPYAPKKMQLQRYPYQTGDLIMVSTETKTEGFFNMSVLIKFFCGTPWNHVGVIYVDPITNEPYIWEMVGSGLARLIPIQDVPDDPFAAKYYIRSINKVCSAKTMQIVMRQQWEDIFNYDIMVPWYSRYMNTITCANGVRWNKGRHKTCSQLAAEVYHALGIMNFTETGVDVSELFPSDFASDLPGPYGTNTSQLPMMNGATFGPLIELEFTRRSKSRQRSKNREVTVYNE